jgi:hypothetical protein
MRVLFFELALEDIMAAADLFRPTYDRSKVLRCWSATQLAQLRNPGFVKVNTTESETYVEEDR